MKIDKPTIADLTNMQHDHTDAVNGGLLDYEPGLGNPEVDGYVLLSTTEGVRSWAVQEGGGMVYPGAGIALSTGTAWGTSITNNSANWNTAYGWGDHASEGYLTSLGTALVDADFTSNGLMKRTAAGVYGIITDASANWNTAYTHSQIAGGNSVHVSTTENTQWDAAYTHSLDNSQAHSDYLINNGNDATSGTLTATNFILFSDERLKQNIKLITSLPIDINCYKSFNLKSDPTQLRYGVTAQSIQKTNPELVRTDEKGIMSVAYIDLIMNELFYLRNKVTELETQLS